MDAENPGSTRTPPRSPSSDHSDNEDVSPAALGEESVIGKGGSGRKPRTYFTGKQLVELARLAVELDPWHAKHKEKGKTWDEIRQRLLAEGLLDSNVSTGTLRNKVHEMIKWHAVRVDFA